jgi:hypothetical protein
MDSLARGRGDRRRVRQIVPEPVRAGGIEHDSAVRASPFAAELIGRARPDGHGLETEQRVDRAAERVDVLDFVEPECA